LFTILPFTVFPLAFHPITRYYFIEKRVGGIWTCTPISPSFKTFILISNATAFLCLSIKLNNGSSHIFIETIIEKASYIVKDKNIIEKTMRLKRLMLDNFRSYKKFQIDFDNSMNVIIGKNDIGKSTILEALEIFFNGDKVKAEIEDLCVKTEEKSFSIGVILEIEKDKKYTIDTIPTSLQDEYLLNSNGDLELSKKWDCSKEKLTATSVKQYIKACYPKLFADDPLICLTNTNLKKTYKNYNEAVEEKGLKVRETTNSEMRQAIYKVSNLQEFQEVSIPIDKIDGKDVWSSISGDLPLYFLFQSDRANKDTDKDVQDPLKAITKTAIDEVADKLNDVKKQIEESAKKIGDETIKKLSEMNPDLANILKPDISNKAWESLFSFSFIGDDNIPMNKRGSGVRRLILLNYFRAEAERQNKTNKTIIYGIEEPETSQHPNHQKLLMEALVEIANQDKSQVLITTHSPEIAKQCKKERLILIDRIEGENKIIESESKLRSIAKTLGIIPYLEKLVICVEGENDRIFLTNINQSIPELKNIIDLKKERVSIIPMEGSTLINWIERDYLKDSNIIEFHLYDKDGDEKYKTSIEEVNKRNNGSFGTLTMKREMENYISPRLYSNEFNIDCSTIKVWDNEDISLFVMNKSKRYSDKKLETKKIVKSIANGKLSKSMTKELLIEINAFDEVKSWFEKMHNMYER
jgi:putative ATP-dependent endonuclease of the OLD family